jgi:hypothetical protein
MNKRKNDITMADMDAFMNLFLKCANCGQHRGHHIDRKKCLFGPGEFKDVLGEDADRVKELLGRIPR